ncbi:hypothetical protein [Flavobacterium piscis]|uniref:Uncharacterized protein n=1 Tax=Flavobacterium piscis TaxID=1114874 RepID=A0ABU1Y2A2_9FLAO|nr:hypothetical protein [Flavobacterium piscis]MDR7208288.1 hypothetical protein [Flavobacterium piscis]
MNKKDIFTGFIIGILTSLLGSYLFITFFTKFDISSGILTIKESGYLGKVITLGTILNLGVFFKKNYEFMARGIILAVIILAISTLFI